MFRTWREIVRQQHSMIKKGKNLILCFFIWWHKFVAWKTTQQTSAEQVHQSSRYETLRQCLREILRNFRLQRLPRSIWLYLLRRGRLPKAKPGHARTNENNESPEAANHSNASVQFIQSGTEFLIQSPVSNQQSHPPTCQHQLQFDLYSRSQGSFTQLVYHGSTSRVQFLC